MIPMLEKPTKKKRVEIRMQRWKGLHLFSHFPFDKKEPFWLSKVEI